MSTAPTPVPQNTGEVAEDLQERMARFSRALLLLGLVLAAASIGTHVATAHRVSESGTFGHEVVHLAALVPPLAVWLLCRGRTLRRERLELIDAALTIGCSALYALLGASAIGSLSAVFSVVLSMTYTLVGRSIIVPSSFVRSLWIGGASAAPSIVYLANQRVASALGQSPEGGRILALFGALWCIVAVFTSAMNSRQLYGLRARIREIHKLGQYTLEEKIGEGGMGAVYRAKHALLRRPAAIKLLLKERSSARDHARFEREVQLTSHLAHPNTVSIFDYGHTADGVFYYVMEYLDGCDLSRLVEADGPVAPARAIHILKQVCGALGEAHALGLVHRDIKPANIVLTERVDEPDVVKVVDFGLARTLERNDADTRAGALLGTPLYLAPEAIKAPDSVDGRSDLYALGAVAYYMLSGRNVFDGNTTVEVLGRHLLEAPVSPSKHLATPLPGDLEALVLACLAKDPAARPATASALLTALLACRDAGRYDRSAAIAWWRERGGALRGRNISAAVSPTTMTVALDGRRVGESKLSL
jgi:serine/threonine-protein kinase